MAPILTQQEERIILTFYGQLRSLRKVKNKLLEEGISRSVASISRVINNVGKRREMTVKGEQFKYQRQSPVLTQKVLFSIQSKFSTRNPPTFEQASKKLGIPKTTINRAVLDVLGMKKRKKTRVHCLNEKDEKNRKRTSRKLYETFLRGQKSKYIVTLDEALIRFYKKSSETDHYYVKRGKKEEEKKKKETKSCQPPRFMIVAAMCESRTFPLIKVPENVKVDAQFYSEFVLQPLIELYLVPHFGKEIEKVTIHHDQARSHTARMTTDFMAKMKEMYGVSIINKEMVPVKSPDI